VSHPNIHIRGPYEPGTAGEAGFQLACYGCTIADLIALAGQRNVKPRHVLDDVTRGARRKSKMGKIASDRMGGRTWIWEISLNGGPPQVDVSLSVRQPQMRVKILVPRTI
jgi:hypothetical protein